MITTSVSGSFDKTERSIRKLASGSIFNSLSKYGEMGKAALSAATPRESGATAAAWSYKIEKSGAYWSITWFNGHSHNGFPVAIMLQYGHGTGTGGYVSGRNFINPAIKPIFDQIDAAVSREVAQA